jgi:hypothetical protein
VDGQYVVAETNPVLQSLLTLSTLPFGHVRHWFPILSVSTPFDVSTRSQKFEADFVKKGEHTSARPISNTARCWGKRLVKI